jgi:acetylornithine deacetylase/succinyl-diaminopimelate desuccinylase family protein
MIGGEDSLCSLAGRYRDQAVHLLRTLVEIPSVTGEKEGYKAMAAVISEEMEAMGFETEQIGVDNGKPNVVGTFNPDGKPVLLLNGHIDVVPPGPPEHWKMDPFSLQIDGDRLFGRGACDMKGGLVAMLLGARMFLESEPTLRGSLILTATVDEEIGGFDGLGYLMDHGMRADFGVVCEPTDLNIVNVFKGLIWIKLISEGKEAHGSMPENGVNAIDKMAKVLNKLEKTPPWTGCHPILGNGTINVGVIHAGTKPNVVPGKCEAQIDVRYLPGQTHKDVLRNVEATISELKNQDNQLEARAEIIRYRMPAEIPAASEIISRVSMAAERVTGRRPTLRGMVSPGDVEHLFRSRIPSIMFGPGSESLAHCPNEWVSIDSILTGSAIYARLFADVLT